MSMSPELLTSDLPLEVMRETLLVTSLEFIQIELYRTAVQVGLTGFIH